RPRLIGANGDRRPGFLPTVACHPPAPADDCVDFTGRGKDHACASESSRPDCSARCCWSVRRPPPSPTATTAITGTAATTATSTARATTGATSTVTAAGTATDGITASGTAATGTTAAAATGTGGTGTSSASGPGTTTRAGTAPTAADGTRSAVDGRQPGLGDLHVLRVVPAAHADAADDLPADGDRVAAAEDDEAVDAGRSAERQGRVVLDEVVPAVGRQAEADGGVGLVLGDLHAEEGGAVHAAEGFEHAALVDDGDDEGMAHQPGLRLGGGDDAPGQIGGDARLVEGVGHGLSLSVRRLVGVGQARKRSSSSRISGRPMKSRKSAKRGSSSMIGSGVPARRISARAWRIQAVVPSSVAIGKITILNPSPARVAWSTGGVLPPSAQLNSSGTSGKARATAAISSSVSAASTNSTSAPARW